MRQIFIAGVLAVAAACATTGKPAAGQRDAERISQQEVEAANGTTAYEVISRARPQFLKSRGASTMMTTADQAWVYLNGVAFGDITTLRNIPAAQIREIRYYNARDAVQKFGSQLGLGAIDISTK